MTQPYLRVENIVKKFGPFTALNGVNLEVYPGEVHALLGDNGAGKSSLIKIISGVHRTSQGAMIVDGKKVDEEMFAWMFILIMVGGNESTRTATAHGMRLLIEHPEQLQHLVDHPEDIPDAVEEMLRYNTAFIAMRRTATQDIEWNGHNIKKGDKVVLHYHAVNHDEDAYGDDAMKFDIHRAKRLPNMRREIRSFGIGEHFCLGMNLARMELNIIFEELIPRLRNPKFAGDVTYMRSFFINTIKAMPITFDPEV